MRYNSVRIGEHVLKVDTWNPAKDMPEGLFSYIDLSSVDKDGKSLIFEQIKRIPTMEAPSRARQLVDKNDVLVATVRPNLNGVAYINQEYDNATASTGYCVLRTKESLDYKFLYYWVRTKSFVNDMVKKATGASYPAVSDKIIKTSKIPLPPLPQQKKIAVILDAADTYRQKTKALITKYEELTQSLFLEMFGESFNEKNNFSAISDLTSFIDYRGKTLVKVKNGIPYITAKSVRIGYFDKSRLDYITSETYDKIMTRGYPKIGDVLFTTEGATMGFTCRIPKGFTKFSVGQRLITLQTNENYNSTVLEYMLNSKRVQGKISQLATGSAVKGIRAAKFKTIKIPVPPINLQTQFAERVQAIEAQKAQAQSSLAQAEDLFNCLLQQAFKGELLG